MTWAPISLTKPGSITSAATQADLHALATQVGSVMVSPFQHGIGEGERAQLLTFNNAVDALAQKLASINPQATLCLAFASSTLHGLVGVLQAAVNNTGLGELISPLNRAELLNNLQQYKLQIVSADGVQVADKPPHTVLHPGNLADCYKAKLSETALADATNAVGEISAELSNFEALKTAHDSQVNAAFAAVDVGSVTGLAVHFSGGDVANQLRDAGGGDANKTHVVMLALYGDDLQLLNEWVGL